jgi:hypothetical protein
MRSRRKRIRVGPWWGVYLGYEELFAFIPIVFRVRNRVTEKLWPRFVAAWAYSKCYGFFTLMPGSVDN